MPTPSKSELDAWLTRAAALLNGLHRSVQYGSSIVAGEVSTSNGVHMYRVKRDEEGFMVGPGDSTTEGMEDVAFVDYAPISKIMVDRQAKAITDHLCDPCGTLTSAIAERQEVVRIWMMNPTLPLNLPELKPTDAKPYHDHLLEAKGKTVNDLLDIVDADLESFEEYAKWRKEPRTGRKAKVGDIL